MSRNRNYLIDLMRFYFSIIILLYHSPKPIHFFKNKLFTKGYIGVEFFFICSGLFLINTLKQTKNEDYDFYCLKITYNKFKKIIIPSMITFLLCYFLYFFISDWSVVIAIQQFILHLPEMFFLCITGIVGNFSILWMKPFWYLSVLLFLTPLFTLLYTNKKKYMIFFQCFLPLFIYGYFNMNFGTVNVWGEKILGISYGTGILRGCAGMMIGCILAEIIDYFKSKKSTFNSNLVYLFKMAGVIILILFTSISLSLNDIFIIFIICFLILTSFFFRPIGNTMFINISKFFGEISLPIYLIQSFTIPLSISLFNKESLMIIFYILCSISISILLYFLSKYLYKFLSKVSTT